MSLEEFANLIDELKCAIDVLNENLEVLLRRVTDTPT